MKKILFVLSFLIFSNLIFSQGRVIFKKEIFNFSHVVRDGGMVKYRFNLKNKTDELVKIIGASTDSYFITLDWFRQSIERDGKGFIQVIIDPSATDFGKYNEKIIVYTTADEENAIILTVMCEIVDKLPEPKIEPYLEHFGVLSDDASMRSKKYVAFIESLANYIMKKGAVSLQVESSMSPMSIANYSNKIAKSRAENFQSEIIKSISKYDIDSKKIKFITPKILIQGPEYSKKSQGKSKECSKFQYVKVLKME